MSKGDVREKIDQVGLPVRQVADIIKEKRRRVGWDGGGGGL